MNYPKINRMKLITALIVLFVLFQVYKFIGVRIINMDLPKGKIVFSSSIDGDDEIYVMNINGTNLKQLTKNSATKTNMATDDRPSFSLDGKKIVFRSSRLGVRDYRIITNNRGRAIGEVFSGGSTDIYIMDSDGSNQTPLTYQDLCSDLFFSPDGKKIGFRSNRPSSLRMIDIDTLEQRVLNFGGGQFEFSKDGMKIFDNLKNDISVTDITGINKMRLTHFSDSQEIRGNRENRLGIAFTLSPDGKKIAVVTKENKDSQSSRLFKFYTMNIDGSGLEEVNRLETRITAILPEFKYSPDGNKIIFELDYDTPGIYSLNLINRNVTDLTGEKENWDSFSKFDFTLTPNGRRIVFMANIYPKNYRLALLFYNIKAWFKYLVLWKKAPFYDNKYLCIIDIDGNNYRRIAKLPEGTELGRDFIHWEK